MSNPEQPSDSDKGFPICGCGPSNQPAPVDETDSTPSASTHSKRSIALLPLFKADRPAPTGEGSAETRTRNEMIMTGRSWTGEPLPPEARIQLLQDAAMGFQDLGFRELTENFARVCACVLYGRRLQKLGTPSGLYAVEGTMNDWGHVPRTGAETDAAIYASLPEELRAGFPPMVVDSFSHCTREEIKRALVLAQGHGSTELHAVTHPYHEERARIIADDVREDLGSPVIQNVTNPEEIASFVTGSGKIQPADQFLLDAIRIGEPSRATAAKEWIKERGLLRPLHRISRWTQRGLRGIGVDFDLEGWLAERKRERVR